MRLPGGTILRAALGASVVLNLVLAGVLLAGPLRPATQPRGFERMVARIETALPEADRPKFHAVLEAERGRYEGPLAALRAARAQVDSAMMREPFDPAALRAAMQDWSDRWVAFSAAYRDMMVQAMAAISPEGRAQVAAARRGGG